MWLEIKERMTDPSLVAQGSYGCIFDPPSKCRGSEATHPKSVGKVFYDPSHSENEARAMEVVRRIDPKGRYTVPMRVRCPIDPTPAMRKACSHLSLSEGRGAVKDVEQIVYPRAGQDLVRYVESNPDFDVLDLVSGMAQVMEGLRLLAGAGYCHRDMKPSNIMVQSKGRRMRITDFGMTCPFDRLYAPDQGYVLAFNYEYYPPEFKIYYDYALAELEYVNDPTLFIANDVRLNYLDAPLQWITDLADFKTVVTKVLGMANYDPAPTEFKGAPTDVLRSALEGLAEKVDVFGAGASFMRVFDMSSKKYASPKHTVQRGALYDTLRACTDLNPITRITAAEARDRLRRVALDLSRI